MANTDGIPVIGGLFKIVKAPFKLLGGVGETGLGILNADGTQFGNGLKGTWNSIWDVPEGAFDTVKDIAGAGEIFSNDIHFGENKKTQASPQTQVAPQTRKKPVTTVQTPKNPVVPPVVKKPTAPAEPPKAQVVPPVAKKPTAPAEPPKAQVVPPATQKPTTPAEPPKAQVVPPVAKKPTAPAEPPKAKDKAKDSQKTEKKGIMSSIADFFQRGTTGEKILKYTVTTIGVIAAAFLLKKGASGLLKFFSKNKKTDPMIKTPELYEALKGKKFEPKYGHRGVVPTAPQPERLLLEYKPNLATTPASPKPTAPAPTPIQPKPVAPEPKLPPQVTPADILAGKFTQTAKVPTQPTTVDTLKPLQSRVKPRPVVKSGVVKAEEIALAKPEKAMQIHTIGDQELKRLAEKAERKQYLPKVTAEVKAQAKARAQKAAAEAAEKKAEQKAAEQVAQNTKVTTYNTTDASAEEAWTEAWRQYEQKAS